MVIGGAVTLLGGVAKEKLFETPDLALEARICAPLVKGTVVLVDSAGKRHPIENPELPNPVQIVLRNIGKKQLENVEVTLEFSASGDVRLQNQSFGTHPPNGFGKVELFEDTPNRKRIRIALLNPKDEVEYSAFAVRPITIVAYSKLPGLSFFQVQRPGCSIW